MTKNLKLFGQFARTHLKAWVGNFIGLAIGLFTLSLFSLDITIMAASTLMCLSYLFGYYQGQWEYFKINQKDTTDDSDLRSQN